MTSIKSSRKICENMTLLIWLFPWVILKYLFSLCCSKNFKSCYLLFGVCKKSAFHVGPYKVPTFCIPSIHFMSACKPANSSLNSFPFSFKYRQQWLTDISKIVFSNCFLRVAGLPDKRHVCCHLCYFKDKAGNWIKGSPNLAPIVCLVLLF